MSSDFNRDNKLKRQGKLYEAIVAYKRAIELNPNFSWSHYNLGKALACAGKLEDAISSYRRAVVLNPVSAWFHYSLGEALSKMGQLDEAIAYFQRAIKLNPDVHEFYNSLGNALAELAFQNPNSEFKPKKGVIYVATGKRYIEEALKSAASLKDKMPDLPVTIFSSDPIDSHLFEKVVVIENPNYDHPGLDKIENMLRSPYEYTLFLDTDTYIYENFLELFSLLHNWDIAAAHAPSRKPTSYLISGKPWITYDFEEVPNSFAQMNTGVILFRKTPDVEVFFKNWFSLCELKIRETGNSGKPLHDQATFRAVLWHSSLRVATLAPEYNFRFPSVGFVNGTVKILHGRHPDIPSVAAKINSTLDRRLWDSKDLVEIQKV